MFNQNIGRIEIIFNIDVTSYTPIKQNGPTWLFNYDFIFTSFNVPFTVNAGTSGVKHSIVDDNQDIEIIPRSSISSTVSGDPDTRS